VLSIMMDTDEGFLVRRPKGESYTSAVEEMVAKIGQRIGRQVVAMPPDGGHRAASFQRDIRMVSNCSHVYAFFAPGEIMQGGTGHVVACALREGKPVDAFELDSSGNVVEVGSDPGDLLDAYGGAEWS
jgi:hypothetical protein